MFGYVTIRKPELKIKDYECYHSFYCGLCYQLRKIYGIRGQITLTYDMTFLVILLSSIYEDKVSVNKRHCILHPVKRHTMRYNSITCYGADMNVLLSYFHFKDNWVDDKSMTGAVGTLAYKGLVRRIKEKYPSQTRAIVKSLSELSRLERENCQDVLKAADTFGKLMEELFLYKRDAFSNYLKSLGYHLGRYIYIMDAYDDLKDDLEKGKYNPLSNLSKQADFEEKVREIMLCEMSEASAAFEMLPCVEYLDILRNILYAGVWNRYDRMILEREDSSIAKGGSISGRSV